MAEMMRRAGPGFLGPEYNNFLFATVGAERNGGYLSVVSALARLDLDPWAEAAKLARLPADRAIAKLTAAIAAQRDLGAGEAPAKIAARLVALLPRSAAAAAARQAPTSNVKTYLSTTSIVVLAFALLLAAQFAFYAVQSKQSHPANPASISAELRPQAD